ncbi:hypothetical protein EEB12_29225 [Rhodococcus sp. WS1]|uniref:NAD(P)H-dependent oxidoreductase n=1 Tax=unclassified Rhodococcus (in: high G+C Gram-positive bacteria) TaxID=192944 RepID=UPI001143A35C|nr:MULTISPECIES: NAD(P)H-dependent oxidoreductase [unclassified Rhodococcus (in: high G+C Gram-positive bacteria)]ROZ52915.1 hypothetical protein EEB12_29225 [Rhodococcus sp. WS1]TQC36006.1 hypothetical protein EEB16_20820 [Rhodococcus sp. WS7]
MPMCASRIFESACTLGVVTTTAKVIMSTLLHIDVSPRIDQSVSRSVASAFVASWRKANPDSEVMTRDLALHPIPHVGLELVDESIRKDVQPGSPDALRNELIDELTSAEVMPEQAELIPLATQSLEHGYAAAAHHGLRSGPRQSPKPA